MAAEKLPVPGWPENFVSGRKLVSGIVIQKINAAGWLWLFHEGRKFQVTGKDLSTSMKAGQMLGSLLLMHKRKNGPFFRDWPVLLPGGWKAAFRDGKVACLICDQEMKLLSRTHLVSHGTNRDEYCQKFGIPKGTSFSVPSQRQKHESLLPNNDGLLHDEPNQTPLSEENQPEEHKQKQEVVTEQILEQKPVIHSRKCLSRATDKQKPETTPAAPSLPEPNMNYMAGIRMGLSEWPNDGAMPAWEWEIRRKADLFDYLERAFDELWGKFPAGARLEELLQENIRLRKMCSRLLGIMGQADRKISGNIEKIAAEIEGKND